MAGKKNKKNASGGGKKRKSASRRFDDLVCDNTGTGFSPPVERFQYKGPLGSGGLCDVYEAADLLLVRWGDPNAGVALKQLRKELTGNAAARQLLIREFMLLRHIAHPGVVRVYDLHESETALSISMELLQGPSLHDALARRPGLPLPRGRGVAAALFETLAFLHGVGVAHGDIKPGNIMLPPDGRVVLLDFNTATAALRPGPAGRAVSLNMYAELRQHACSMLHAAPERLLGEPPDFAGDVFSACCTVYETLQGEHPFQRKTALEAEAEGRIPEPPPGLSSRRRRLLTRGLSFAKEERPTADALFAAFREDGALHGLRRFCAEALGKPVFQQGGSLALDND